jgi:ribosomal protein S18 acetylase RimI-like enzyme
MPLTNVDTLLLQARRTAADAAFSIRRATFDDVHLLVELGARTFCDTYGPYNDPGTMKDYLASSFSPKQIASELAVPTSIFLLASQGRKAIGYAKLDVDALPDGLNEPRAIRLFRMYVDRRYAGNGCGTALMRSCLKAARQDGYQSIWLGVWEQNGHAQAFYQKHGFRSMGSQNFIFGREIQKDVIMARAIDRRG